MGLVAAYQALCDGHQVSVLEAAPEAGGMSAHFDFGGISLERFYHFICRSDRPTLDLLQELGISHKLKWRETSMGFYSQGQLIPWGNPISLLRVPRCSLMTKLRYGMFVFACMHRSDWSTMEKTDAKTWVTRWCGAEGYDRFWRSLLDYKFHEYSDRISAAWIWSRIRRVGESRKSMMVEELGYLEGGSQTLVDAMVDAIEKRGGQIHLNTPARAIQIENNKVYGVEAAQENWAADYVISTIPIPLVSKLLSSVNGSWKLAYERIHSIGVCCVIMKLKRPVSPHFWINIEDKSIEIPGVIEFSNLREVGPTIVYIPYYLPSHHPKFSWTNDVFIQDSMRCLMKLNPGLTMDDLVDASVFRLKHAQPVCEVSFASLLPPVQTPVDGLQIADTAFYYPEDRSIAESIRLGRKMARDLTCTA
jgi:protoporphyrinogen oxidase